MSFTRQVLTRVRRELSETLKVHRNVLYMPSFDYFARGIVLEQTSYKDTVRLRRFLLPFFGTIGFAHVSYSPRVYVEKRGETDDIVGPPRFVADAIVDWAERDGLLAKLQSPYTPRDFLPPSVNLLLGPEHRHEFRWIEPFELFDYLCAATLDRQTELQTALMGACDDCVRHAPGPRWPTDNFTGELMAFHAVRAQGLPALDEHLRRVCHDNAIALGFQPAPLASGPAG